MSPTTGFGSQVCTRSMTLSSVMVPFTRYLSSAMNETTVTRPPYSLRVTAIGSPAMAPLRNPCGVRNISSRRCSATWGMGMSRSIPAFQACSPLTISVSRRSPTMGAPPPRAA